MKRLFFIVLIAVVLFGCTPPETKKDFYVKLIPSISRLDEGLEKATESLPEVEFFDEKPTLVFDQKLETYNADWFHINKIYRGWMSSENGNLPTNQSPIAYISGIISELLSPVGEEEVDETDTHNFELIKKVKYILILDDKFGSEKIQVKSYLYSIEKRKIISHFNVQAATIEGEYWVEVDALTKEPTGKMHNAKEYDQTKIVKKALNDFLQEYFNGSI